MRRGVGSKLWEIGDHEQAVRCGRVMRRVYMYIYAGVSGGRRRP